jgi:hypothetical protein
MWIREQQGVSTGGPPGRDGPGIGAALPVAGLALHAPVRGEKAGKGESFLIGHHVHAGHRQHGANGITDQLRMPASELVDAGDEGIDVRAHRRALQRIVARGEPGNVDGPGPAVFFQIVAAEQLRCASASLGIETEQEIAVVLHLRPAEGVRQLIPVRGVDVRHAVAVPEDLR